MRRKKLIIELDGEIHERPKEKARDERRDIFLSEQGYQIVRFKNKELDNIEKLLNKIKKYL